MDVQLSSRSAARLIVTLVQEKLTPVAKAAARHERALARVFLAGVKRGQDAVPMEELIDVLSLGHPGTACAWCMKGSGGALCERHRREAVRLGVKMDATGRITRQR